MFRLSAPAARHGRARGPRPALRPDPDGGFLLLESVIAITVVMVISAALTSLLIGATHSTTRQRSAQVAAQLAVSALDKAQSIGAAAAIAGRDSDSVQDQFAATPVSVDHPAGLPAVASWLTTMQRAVDSQANSGAGADAALPTTPSHPSVNGTVFSVNYFVGNCWRANAATGNCTTSQSGVAYVQVVVAVAWHASGCPAVGCVYVSASLLNGDADPVFNFDQQPPPKPVLATIPNQLSQVGDTVLGLTGVSACQSPCAIPVTSGVLPFTYSVTGLPPGLELSTDPSQSPGLVVGSPTTPGTYTVSITVTDAFRDAATGGFTWTVKGADPLQFASPGNQTNQVGDAVNLTLTASGGNPGYGWSVQNLPPGLSLNLFGQITGTVTADAVAGSPYTVTVTVSDSTKESVSHAFSWKITPVLAISAPSLLPITTVGQTVSTTASFACPNAPCTFTASGLPGGVQIAKPTSTATSGTITLSGKVTGSAGNKSTTLTITDSKHKKATATFTWPVLASGAPALQLGTVSGQFSTYQYVMTSTAANTLTLNSSCPSGGCTYSVSALKATSKVTVPASMNDLTLAPTSDVTINSSTGKLTVANPATWAGKQSAYLITVTIAAAKPDTRTASLTFGWVFQ